MRRTGLSNAVPSKVSLICMSCHCSSPAIVMNCEKFGRKPPKVGFADQAEVFDVVSALSFGFARPVV